MDIPLMLLAVVIIPTSMAICVVLFERLGFGSILGFTEVPPIPRAMGEHDDR